MSKTDTGNSISPMNTNRQFRNFQFIDVRKPLARAASGKTIAGANYRHPFDAKNWVADLAEGPVLVFCVYGHEVSQAVCGYLRDEGIDAKYLEGGFEAWKAAGYLLEDISDFIS